MKPMVGVQTSRTVPAQCMGQLGELPVVVTAPPSDVANVLGAGVEVHQLVNDGDQDIFCVIGRVGSGVRAVSDVDVDLVEAVPLQTPLVSGEEAQWAARLPANDQQHLVWK